ncbi:MAG TPA: hypothetical protein VME17_16670 [Bryobacteraceae bacterium]|nr:hypothetical protein [Bryobacteraceae bacterium]
MLRVAFACCFGLLTGLLPVTGLSAQPMPQAAAQLAARISFLVPHRTIASLDLVNLSALPPAEWSSFRSLLNAEFRKAGLAVTAPSSPDPRVRVTLADSAQGLLLVAEVGAGDNRQIAMLRWTPPALAEDKPRFTITKKLLWTQPEPILDVLLLNSGTQMLVLGANKIAIYNLSGSNWMPGAIQSLVLPRPIPRDPCGRLEPASDGFRAYLPGASCTGSMQPDLRVTCAPGNEAWTYGTATDTQVRWVTDRNVLESDAVKGPFYTAANGVYAMADDHVTGPDAWGSDIASVDSACGAAVIATSTATDRDSVRAYQNTAPASDALPLSGPATALWPAETSGQATLVVHNLQTGVYEAYRLGLACAQ